MSLPLHARPAPAARVRASWLPREGGLPEAEWAWRHRVVCWVLAAHVPALTLLTLLQGEPVQVLFVVLPLGALLALAYGPLSRRLRGLAAWAC